MNQSTRPRALPRRRRPKPAALAPSGTAIWNSSKGRPGLNGRRPSRHGAIGRVLLTLLSLLVVALGAGVTWKIKQGGKGNELANLIVETVKRAALEISITERGSLESAANMTLVCQVEGDAGTGILKIVDEGTRAVKDQVLVELDSSRL